MKRSCYSMMPSHTHIVPLSTTTATTRQSCLDDGTGPLSIPTAQDHRRSRRRSQTPSNGYQRKREKNCPAQTNKQKHKSMGSPYYLSQMEFMSQKWLSKSINRAHQPLESHHELMQSLAFGGIRTKIWFSTLSGCPYIFNGKSACRD
jgi:hypothetical protein